jgi:hypothetical protein
MLEAMFASSIGALLFDGLEEDFGGVPGDSPCSWRPGADAIERERLRDAVLADDDHQVDAAVRVLFARIQPEAAIARDVANARRRARQFEEVQRMRSWIAREFSGRTATSRAESDDLNGLLRSWFKTVAVTMDASTVEFVADRRHASGPRSSRGRHVCIDRVEWTRFAPLERRPHTRHRWWEDAEIIGAM